MAISIREDLVEHWVVRLLPLRTLENALALAKRFGEVDGMRFYVEERYGRMVAASVVLVLISIACAVGVLVFLADRHSLLALLGILLLPVTLAGSLFVMAYIFFSWIEGRALARELGNRHRPRPGAATLWLVKKLGLDMGPFPPVPWLLVALALLLPLALLAAAWPGAAVAVIFLGILMPVLYAKFDT